LRNREGGGCQAQVILPRDPPAGVRGPP
jgi:hypothetical protein